MSNLRRLNPDAEAVSAATPLRPADAPNITVEMVDGIAKVIIGENSAEAEANLLMEAFGAEDQKIMHGIISQIGNAVSVESVDQMQMQFVVALVKSVRPENELEMLLATQMAVAHICSMEASRRFMQSKTLPARDSAERAANKFLRTFTTQMEALKRFRHGGQQKVTVEHVTVNKGGQAIVGSVAQTGGRVK